MYGGEWVARPGNIIDFRVDILRRDDPAMLDIDDFYYRSEQYYMQSIPPTKCSRRLASAVSTPTGSKAR
jgi:type 1 glutamine amidotransferase